MESFKYLGTHIDQKLSFTPNVDFICKKAHQRLYLLRKLRSFGVKKDILQMVYKSLVESILTFNIITWFENLTVKNRSRLVRITNVASKIIGRKQKPLVDIYNQSVRRKTVQILSDSRHYLHDRFERLPSGKRFRTPLAKKKLYRHSFIVSATKYLNPQTN